MIFDSDLLWQRLQALPSGTGYCVAFSGGRDSHVLLHALVHLRPRLSLPVRAIHVDHGLQPRSADWMRHCEAICRALDVPLSLYRATVDLSGPVSAEAAAREARYAVFEAQVGAGEILLLAHHRDDQAETLLLRLLRGAGIRGIASMPPERPIGRGLLLRPLLDVPRAALAAYAMANALQWVEDPSNADTRFDRNFVRHRLLPVLAERWPAHATQLARTSAHAREAQSLLDELAAQDFVAAASEEGLKVSVLSRMSAPRQRNLVRFWIDRQGLPSPPAERLQDGLAALLSAGADRQPQLRWGTSRIRRYRDLLLLDTDAPAAEPAVAVPWNLGNPLELPAGTLTATRARGAGLRADLADGAGVTVRFRRGGERCRLVGRSHRQTLKQLLQDAGVPPWERELLPLLYVGDELAAIGGRWLCEGFQARADEPGLLISWHRK